MLNVCARFVGNSVGIHHNIYDEDVSTAHRANAPATLQKLSAVASDSGLIRRFCRDCVQSGHLTSVEMMAETARAEGLLGALTKQHVSLGLLRVVVNMVLACVIDRSAAGGYQPGT